MNPYGLKVSLMMEFQSKLNEKLYKCQTIWIIEFDKKEDIRFVTLVPYDERKK